MGIVTNRTANIQGTNPHRQHHGSPTNEMLDGETKELLDGETHELETSGEPDTTSPNELLQGETNELQT